MAGAGNGGSGAPCWKLASQDEVLCPSLASPPVNPGGGKGSSTKRLQESPWMHSQKNVFAWINLKKITDCPCDLNWKRIFDFFFLINEFFWHSKRLILFG